MGLAKPFNSDIFGSTFVFEEPRPRPLIMETVLLRLTRGVGWGYLLPRMPDDMAFTFRRLSVREAAWVAIFDAPRICGYGGRLRVLV